MFEVGFSELCMVGLVAVLVIGPENLPKVASVAGFWISKSRRMIRNLKAEVQAELTAAELQQQNSLKQLQDLISDTDTALQAVHDEAPERIKTSLGVNPPLS
jgi:sec-independent protein translocase protein TatB